MSEERTEQVGPRAELAEVFVQLAKALLDDDDVVQHLDHLARACVDVLPATASAVMLVDPHGAIAVVAASDERSELLELFQVQRDEGPCLESVRSGAAVLSGDLQAQVGHWPTFAPQALSSGFRSVSAFPLRWGTQVIGGLNLFHSTEASLTDEDALVAQALADAATISILHRRELRHSHEVAEQLQNALDSRIVIEQAKGMLAEYTGSGTDEAFVLLRRYCRDRNLRLSDTARRLTERSLALAAVAGRAAEHRRHG